VEWLNEAVDLGLYRGLHLPNPQPRFSLRGNANVRLPMALLVYTARAHYGQKIAEIYLLLKHSGGKNIAEMLYATTTVPRTARNTATLVAQYQNRWRNPIQMLFSLIHSRQRAEL
jgi:hypothetical protein